MRDRAKRGSQGPRVDYNELRADFWSKIIPSRKFDESFYRTIARIDPRNSETITRPGVIINREAKPSIIVNEMKMLYKERWSPAYEEAVVNILIFLRHEKKGFATVREVARAVTGYVGRSRIASRNVVALLGSMVRLGFAFEKEVRLPLNKREGALRPARIAVAEFALKHTANGVISEKQALEYLNATKVPLAKGTFRKIFRDLVQAGIFEQVMPGLYAITKHFESK
jgi:hypothetical protein